MFLGENGCGKSTLIEALAYNLGLNMEGGSRNFNFPAKEEISDTRLWDYIQISRETRERDSFFFRAESMYNVATEIDRQPYLSKYYGGRLLHEQSHGERFLALIQNRLSCGLYLFDEPEAALSPTRQMTLLVELQRLVHSGSQIIMTTHSPILMAYPNAKLYEFSENDMKLSPWDEISQVQVMKSFLNNKQRMLQILLEENAKQNDASL